MSEDRNQMIGYHELRKRADRLEKALRGLETEARHFGWCSKCPPRRDPQYEGEVYIHDPSCPFAALSSGAGEEGT